MGIDLSAIANHNLSFSNPVDFLKQLEKETGLPYFIRRISSYSKAPDILPPDNFKGWIATHFDNTSSLDEEYEKEKSFDLYLENEDLYISSFCFAGFSPNTDCRWYCLVRALTSTKNYADDNLEDVLQEFDEQRKNLFNWLQKFKGSTAVYCCDYTMDVWDFGLTGKTIDEVIAYAKEKYLVHKYPEELSIIQQSDFDAVCRSLIIVDTFSDFSQAGAYRTNHKSFL